MQTETRLSGVRRPRHSSQRRLTVKPTTAQELLDVGPTKFWSLVKTGKIKLVKIGDSRMVVYSSLEELIRPDAA
jgi:hypothetical protein